VRSFVVIAAAVFTAACTESFEGGEGCPLLCPQEQAAFKDTVLYAIAVDTTLGPYPILGLSNGALLASRGDTLETYVVIRFDNLPDVFNPNNESLTVPIERVDSTVLRVFVDTTGSRAAAPFTVQVYDVDTPDGDTASQVVASMFRADRLLGARTIAADSITDSVRVVLPDSVLEARIANRSRLRLGVRIAPGSNAQLRIGAFAGGEAAPRLTFDPATDTTYAPLDVVPRTTLAGAESDDALRLAYTVYTLTIKGTPPPPPGSLVVGGWPARRTFLEFNIPRAILDSSTVVRADLLLDQRPSISPDARDSVGVQPFITVTNPTVRDLYFVSALSANGLLAGVEPRRLVPSDSGPRAFNIVNVVRSWRSTDTTTTRAIVLRIDGEGSVGTQLLFFNSTAPLALRPRVRLTYLPRAEFALP
jgi:hypothetical protein